MDLSEGSRHYLENYFLLEQTRNETHAFLEEIAEHFTTLVEDRLKHRADGPLEIRSLDKQKGGGYVEFCVTLRPDSNPPADMKDWKYHIIYRDAMRTQKLDDPTDCRVFGWNRKQDSRQISQVMKTAGALGLERGPYDETILGLVDAPVDEVVDRIVAAFESYYDNYARIIGALIDEVDA